MPNRVSQEIPFVEKDDLSSEEIHALVQDICQRTKKASGALLNTSNDIISSVLRLISKKIVEHTQDIIEANALDLEYAVQKGLSEAMIDRLKLTPERIDVIAKSVSSVDNLENPVGRVLWKEERPNGLIIEKTAVPFGVLGMIYESRPNVTVDAAVLCLKSRNAVVLRGGSESIHSSLAFHKIIQSALEDNNLPKDCVSIIPVRNREAVSAILQSDKFIDVIIPRGGKSLIERVMSEARMPVFGHLEGLCHTYIHKSAKANIAKDVTYNAKMRRTGICGATETLLIDKDLTPEIAKSVLGNLLDEGCEIVGDKLSQALDSRIGNAQQIDWQTEYLDKKLSCCVVSNVEEAVEHINSYGSHHTDSILAEDKDAVEYFLQNVDSGIVMHNASTQFADGGEFGMGAEIGIGTGKLHARGPVGIEQLCTYKYIVKGTGQTRP